MVGVGNPNNLIVSSNWILKQGTDTYILKNTLTLDLSRGRFRDAISQGPVNTFGAGDHSVPVNTEADITKMINWANLNARDQNTGFLPNLPYTIQANSKPFTPTGTLPAVTVTITDGEISDTTIGSPGSGLTSVILTLSGGSPTRAGKIVGIVSEGQLVQVVVIDKGFEYGSPPIVTESEPTGPIAFEFNAEVGDVSFSPSETEGRIKIEAVLTITDDAVHPIEA